jgi:hypothetical protein
MVELPAIHLNSDGLPTEKGCESSLRGRNLLLVCLLSLWEATEIKYTESIFTDYSYTNITSKYVNIDVVFMRLYF